MKDWFKARNIWGAAILSLSDAEAGRLAKALWTYTMSGEQLKLSGSEKGAFAMILMTLGQDEQVSADISQKRALAGAIGGKQTQAKPSKPKQTEAKPSICFNKNKNIEIEEDIRNTTYPLDTPYSCSEPEGSEPVNIIARITLVDGTSYEISEQEAAEDKKAYPGVDVEHEYLMMERWGQANPTKRKTRKGIRRFKNSWLDKEQNRYHPEGGGKNEEHRRNYPGYQREPRTKYDLKPELIDTSA